MAQSKRPQQPANFKLDKNRMEITGDTQRSQGMQILVLIVHLTISLAPFIIIAFAIWKLGAAGLGALPLQIVTDRLKKLWPSE